MPPERDPHEGPTARAEPGVADTEPAAATVIDGPDGPRTTPDLLVWILSGLVGLFGLVGTLLGVLLVDGADTEVLEQAMAEQSVEMNVTGLTEAEVVDLMVAGISGMGYGLALAGLLLVAGAVGFVVYQRRVGRELGVDGVGAVTTWTAVGLGTFVAIITSTIIPPFSVLVGGGVAGYLRRGGLTDGATTGGAAGGLTTVPLVAIFAGALYGFATGAPAAAEFGGSAGMLFAFAFLSLTLIALAAAFGAVGGLVGNILATR